MTTKIEELVNRLVKASYICNRPEGVCGKGFQGACQSTTSCRYKEMVKNNEHPH